MIKLAQKLMDEFLPKMEEQKTVKLQERDENNEQESIV